MGDDATDPPIPVDYDRLTRLLKAVFHIAEDVANAEIVPRWSTTGRRQLFREP